MWGERQGGRVSNTSAATTFSTTGFNGCYLIHLGQHWYCNRVGGQHFGNLSVGSNIGDFSDTCLPWQPIFVMAPKCNLFNRLTSANEAVQLPTPHPTPPPTHSLQSTSSMQSFSLSQVIFEKSFILCSPLASQSVREKAILWI